MKQLATILTGCVFVVAVVINPLSAVPNPALFGLIGGNSGDNQTANNQTGNDRLLFGLVKEDIERTLETDGIIKKWGYAVEQYDVTTDDGYILTIFRIPRGKNQTETPTGPRPVVLIQHGLLGSSVMWVNNLPSQDAAFIFADAGYDVWLGNFRGNKYGRKHLNLSPEKDKMAFWDFSWPEMAKYDLPAMINFILQKTGVPDLYYIGHSMGTLTAFVAFSQNKELGKKVKRFYALAPIMKVENIKGPISYVAKFVGTIDNTLWLAGMEEFMPPSWLMKQFGQYVCGTTEMVGSYVCGSALFMIAGPSSKQLNSTRLPVYLAHTPAGTSRRTFIHFGQMINNGKISQYDFGKSENMKRYNAPTPPEYDVTQMETPVGLYWGDSDWLATDLDVRNMAPRLKSIFAKTYIGDFNHMDFLWGQRVTEEVYLPIKRDIHFDYNRKEGECQNPHIH